MAFFDFLTQPIGGFSGGDAAMQGPTESGQSLGTAQGPTWGQLIGAALQYSNSPSGKSIGGAMQQNMGYNPQTNPANITQPMAMPKLSDSQSSYLSSNAYDQGGGGTSLGDIAKIAMMFG